MFLWCDRAIIFHNRHVHAITVFQGCGSNKILQIENAPALAIEQPLAWHMCYNRTQYNISNYIRYLIQILPEFGELQSMSITLPCHIAAPGGILFKSLDAAWCFVYYVVLCNRPFVTKSMHEYWGACGKLLVYAYRIYGLCVLV